jgi:hypothetical protein
MRELVLIAGVKDAAADLARDYDHVVDVAEVRGKGWSGTA